MRAYSYRILVSVTPGGQLTIGLAEDRYVRGRQMASDLVSLRHVPNGDLWAELHRTAARVYNLALARQRGDSNPWQGVEAPPPVDACTATDDGAVQEAIPGF